MNEELVVHAKVEFRGRVLAMDKIVARLTLEDIAPGSFPSLPWEQAEFIERGDRRRRLVDLIAAEFAHALTEALFSAANKGAERAA